MSQTTERTFTMGNILEGVEKGLERTDWPEKRYLDGMVAIGDQLFHAATRLAGNDRPEPANDFERAVLTIAATMSRATGDTE